MHILQRCQVLSIHPTKLWEFIQDPKNLDIITPPDLKFSIVSKVPDIMFNGLIIEYRVRVPLFGQQKWVTEIKHIREGHSFVDEQRLGPYRFWYHYHEVVPAPEGTRMTDRVHYELPYGPLGTMLHRLAVKNTLQRIFDFRLLRLAELFQSPEEP